MANEVKTGSGLCCGVVAGFTLLVFAGTLVATSQLPSLSADPTAKAPPVAAARFLSSVEAGSPVASQAALPRALAGATGTVATGIATGIATGTVATVALPVQSGLTTVSVAAKLNAMTVQVTSAVGFQNGMYAIFGATSGTPQTLRISKIQTGIVTHPGFYFILEAPLAADLPAGAVVLAKPEASYQMSSHQSSSYGKSSGIFKSSDSSLDSEMGSSDSLTGSSAKSSGSFGSSSGGAGGGKGTMAGIAGSVGSSLGSTFGTFLMALCFACCYKSKVIDNPEPGIGQMRKKQHTQPNFDNGLFDCIKDPSICCMSVFCPMVRIAHTNDAADVCGYWETFVCMWCASLCVCGPLALNVYFRMHVKEQLGIHDNCCVDFIQAFFCLPCVTGQQAIAVDEAMGYKFACPCTMTRIPGSEAAAYGGMRPGDANARSCSRGCL